MLTTAYTDLDVPVIAEGVYTPQEDSRLLIGVMDKTGLGRGSRVAVHFARQQVSAAGRRCGGASRLLARASEFGQYA